MMKMKTASLLSFFLTLLGIAVFSGCSSYDHRLNDSSTPYLGISGGGPSQEGLSLADRVSYWDGDNVPGAPSIVINLTSQRLYYYKGNQLVGVSAVSTGSEGRETKAGRYKVIKKDLHHVSSECGDYVDSHGTPVVKNIVLKEVPMPPGTHFVGSPMPCYMMIYPGVGMHIGFLPGVPDSHGCIRLPDRMAKTFFEVTPLGTPVIVER
ncbi:MAG: L,D-transpeptidase family protein [Chthoniobacterales bacterium]|nr:L,D-transpeptidase family protein [Chthoniobacterales bacterium]